MARRLIVEIIGDASSLEAALGKSQMAAAKFGTSMSRMGKTMTRDVTLPIVAAGVASVKMAQSFDATIAKMVGLAGVSSKQASQWRQVILDMSTKVGKGPQELADGLYQIASSGVTGKKAIDALRVSAKASTAGMGETAVVADAVTSAMNAYAKSGLTAKHAVDILSAAVRDGKGEASQFAPVIGKVVAVASQLGVSFDQVAGGMAQMTRLGVPAEDAATQLSATFSALLKTTPAAEKAMNAMGLSSAGSAAGVTREGSVGDPRDVEGRYEGFVG